MKTSEPIISENKPIAGKNNITAENKKSQHSSDGGNNELNNKMQLPSSSATVTASVSQPQVATSTVSAQSSNNGSNFNRPRPRHTNKGGTAGMPPVSSSLPASAVTAAPYIPTSFQSGGGAADYLPPHHHHHHITYATYEAPPPPMGQAPPPPWMAAPSPAYFYEAGPVPPGPPVPPMAGVGPTVPTGPAPPYMQHMCTTMPPPQIAVSSAGITPAPVVPGGPGGGKNAATGLSAGGGRGTPSPHAQPPPLPPPPNHTSTATTVSTSSSIVSSTEIQPQNYEVEYHLHQGEVISFTLSDGRVEIIPGPANIRMVSPNSSSPPLPMAMQVPQGHMVQQIVDQNGTLQHVIMSPEPILSPAPPQQSPHGIPITPTPYTSTIPNVTPGGAIVVTAATGTTPFSAPTAVCSGAPPRQPFPTSCVTSMNYGPPPGPTIIPAGTVTPTPSSHGPSPTPSSGSGGGGFANQQPPGYPRTKTGRIRGNYRQPMVTPPTSPGKKFKVGGSHLTGFGYRNSNTSGKVTTSHATYLSPHMGIVLPPGLSLTSPASTATAHGSINTHHGGGHNSIIASSQVMRTRSPHSKYRGPQESTSFRSPSSGSGSSGIGSSNSSTSGGPNIGSSTSAGSGTVPGGTTRGKTPRTHQDDSEESGVGHEEDEEMQQLLVELLSLIRTPKVTEIEGRSALLKWGPPIRDQGDDGAKFEPLEHISDANFRYEVLLSDKGKDGKYRSIFVTHSIECRLTDLRPCTEYHIRIHALTEMGPSQIRGGASDTVSFLTKSCEPDKPAPPKLVSRNKTSLNLRWNAPNDNGKSILQYILESDEGRIPPQQVPGSWSEMYEPFGEVFTGRAKNFNMNKLQSSTTYKFRLIAENELGRSRPSEIVAFQTQGTAPPKPQPPGLKEAAKSTLHLVWSKRLSDCEFVLHMDDQISGHGFLPVYTGSDTSHISTGLRRNASYKFRLQAQNEEGKSPWSDEVSYYTLPDIPGPPLRPASKGRLHPHSFKVRWDPPSDDGGSLVENYILEIDGGAGWQTVYQGSGLEYICEYLCPGTQYKVRVACTSKGGVSDFSEVCHICTEPIPPGQCAPPRPHGKPKANSLHLKWGWPESDGGSPVTEFEIDMTSPDNKTKGVYRGRETECIVPSLLPGRPYLFQVRAFNRVGAGPWSESLEVVSGAGAPDTPNAPRVQCRGPNLAILDWNEPSFNGAMVTEYRLQLAIVSSRKCLSPPPICTPASSTVSSSTSSSVIEDEEDFEDEDEDEDEDEERQESLDSDEQEEEDLTKRKVVKRKRKSYRNDQDQDEENSDSDDDQDLIRSRRLQAASRKEKAAASLTSKEVMIKEEILDDTPEDDELPKELLFTNIYTGNSRNFEARSLDPATTYQFRVCAVNSAGASDWSDLTEATTPPAAPAAVNGVHVREVSAISLTLAWHRPQSNGEHISHYNIDTGSATVISTSGPETYFTLDSLKPDTIYPIRIQAVNAVGPGVFSSTTRLSTRPLPPAPPRCECVNATHNSLKLKWGDNKSSNTLLEPSQYTLEMEKSRNQFQVIYTGTALSYKVPKLLENKSHRFRMSASNVAGHGPYSQVYEFKTAYAHPHPVKAAPRISNITETGCLVEWSPLKHIPGQGDLYYRVSLTKVRENEAKIIYSGSDTQFRDSGLEPKTEYTIRVCGVRVPVPETELAGPYSPPAIFTTLSTDGSGVSGSGNIATTKRVTSSGTNIIQHRDAAWTDTQRAAVIVFGFTIFAVLIGIIVQQII